MKRWELLGETRTADGTAVTLMRRDHEHLILAGGRCLMSSRMHGSEEALATAGCARLLGVENSVVLVGGLGMGFTLRAALDVLPASATIVVSELVRGIVEWNRGPLGPLAGYPLRDPRVMIDLRDVADTLRSRRSYFDAVLLDVDNGPDAFTTSHNAWLYGDEGLATTHQALKPGGVLAVWSAWEDRRFEQRMRHRGFAVAVERARARLKRGGVRHAIFLGRRQPA